MSTQNSGRSRDSDLHHFSGLYPHQVEGVEFLTRKGRAILADDMGLGKTRQAIVAMEHALPEGVILVVCPASLKLNWAREIRLVDPAARIEVIGAAGAPEGDPRWVIVNYDLLRRHGSRLGQIAWSGVILDEAHFIKNNSQRTARCLKLLGVSQDARGPLEGPSQVYLLTGTPMTNRPRDLFNLLRCVGHPAARSFLTFAKRYCDAYRNDFGWVTGGASNLDELNLLMKEVMLRRTKDEVLDLPPKVRTWEPVEIRAWPVLAAETAFLGWLATSDPSRPNDTDFLARLMKVRVGLHRAKQQAAEERTEDAVAQGSKVVVFTSFTEGLKAHKKHWGDLAVTISGSDSAAERQAAVDRFQTDPDVRVAVCNLIAGGFGITLTAATHVIFQDLDWTPANHLQAEDRAYRLGQDRLVTVEYLYGAGTLDDYVRELLEAKVALIRTVEATEAPGGGFLEELEARLRALAPALLAEGRAAAASPDEQARIEALAATTHRSRPVAPAESAAPRAASGTDLDATGVHEFRSARDPDVVYRVAWGSAGHLECSCDGFRWRGDCKHVREVRATGG